MPVSPKGLAGIVADLTDDDAAARRGDDEVKGKFRRAMALSVAISFATASITLPTTALAALPLALLVEPAANYVGGLIFSSLARQAVLTVGVAANDASWLVPFVNITARAIGMLRIASVLSTYEIPMQVGVAIPAGAVGATQPVSGALGSVTNPYGYQGYKVRVRTTGVCQLNAIDSKDGVYHSLQMGTVYESLDAMADACEAILNLRVYGYEGYSRYFEVVNDTAYGPIQLSYGGIYTYVDRTHVFFRKPDGKGDYSVANSLQAQSDYDFIAQEPKDNVKRLVRTSTGFGADTNDPDWTQAEKDKLQNPAAVKFIDAQGRIVTVAANSTSTVVQSVTQNGADVKVREVQLSPTATALQTNETTIPNATAADVAVATAASGTGTNTGTLTLPTDYARQGEAAAAANVVKAAIDGADIAGVPRSWETAEKLDFTEQKKRLEALTVPEVSWSDWMPSLMPGQAVQCQPVEFRGHVTSGPAAGLDASAFLDICPYLEIVRAVLGYLFGIGTVIYGWRRFIAARAPMGV